jgi:hypothetical protein
LDSRVADLHRGMLRGEGDERAHFEALTGRFDRQAQSLDRLQRSVNQQFQLINKQIAEVQSMRDCSPIGRRPFPAAQAVPTREYGEATRPVTAPATPYHRAKAASAQASATASPCRLVGIQERFGSSEWLDCASERPPTAPVTPLQHTRCQPACQAAPEVAHQESPGQFAKQSPCLRQCASTGPQLERGGFQAAKRRVDASPARSFLPPLQHGTTANGDGSNGHELYSETDSTPVAALQQLGASRGEAQRHGAHRMQGSHQDAMATQPLQVMPEPGYSDLATSLERRGDCQSGSIAASSCPHHRPAPVLSCDIVGEAQQADAGAVALDAIPVAHPGESEQGCGSKIERS